MLILNLPQNLRKAGVFVKILVSACLLGVACKYSGGHNACPALLDAVHTGCTPLSPFCPGGHGGLPTPRPPAERVGGRVLTESGADVTAQYQRGRGCLAAGAAVRVRGRDFKGQQPQLRQRYQFMTAASPTPKSPVTA